MEAIARQLGAIAVEAGRLLRSLQSEAMDHRLKEDGSPTTQADLAAEALILARLAAAFPGITTIAEETTCLEGCGETFFLVDPLDGTRDYMRGDPEYSVNIALVVGDRPVAAALAAPGLRRLWIAGTEAWSAAIPEVADEAFAFQPARVRDAPKTGLTALVSRRHGEPAERACLDNLPIAGLRTASSALKFGLIASGEADLYLRHGATMEWDTAAGDHIVARAGGCVIGAGGRPLAYGKGDRHYRNGAFAALGDPRYASRIAVPEPI